ncbi:MAG: hypothetical protein J6B90_05220 [Lachnospiraceae bacterium]|nr:hypothetical protein [Lachnospiraceae bacterium]
MIDIYIKASHEFFKKNKVEEFQVNIDEVSVAMHSEDELLVLTMQGEVERKIIERLCADILSIIFIYLGAYPRIVSMTENGEIRDFSKLVEKYNSWDYMSKAYMGMCLIDENTINPKKLNVYRTLKKLPIYSMEFLISDSYKKVVSNHKITLLLHVIDGLVSDNERKKAEQEYKDIYKPNFDIGKYRAKVFYLCKNYFFCYEDKFTCEILNLLKVSKDEFVETVLNTRHFYSHFLKENEKSKRLRKGKEMVEYFEIIYFSLRLHLLKRLGVKVKEERIREYLYILHDWILETDYQKKYPVKSKHYQIIRSLEEMENKLLKIK